MFRKLKFLLGIAILALIVSPFVFVIMALENEPQLVDVPELTSADVSRARELFEQNDPRSLSDGEVAALRLSERDIDLMLAYALNRLDAGVSRVELADDAADIALSLKLPDNPVGRYANVSLRVGVEGQRQAVIESLRIGAVRVPAFVANWAAGRIDAVLRRDDRYRDVTAALDSIEVHPSYAAVRYEWRRGLAEDVVRTGRAALGGGIDSELVAVYFDEAFRQGSAFDSAAQVSLREIVAPLFELAGARSAQGADPVSENSAAVLGMTVYVLGINPDLILRTDVSASDLDARPTFTLRGRKDLARHFLVSAALTTASDSVLADAVGLQKEISDSQGGSGFSFADLAADRAGVRLMEFAGGSRAGAAGAQRVLAEAESESSFMPDISGLPESMNEADFERRFGGVGSEDYDAMLADIERRIDALALYR